MPVFAKAATRRQAHADNSKFLLTQPLFAS